MLARIQTCPTTCHRSTCVLQSCQVLSASARNAFAWHSRLRNRRGRRRCCRTSDSRASRRVTCWGSVCERHAFAFWLLICRKGRVLLAQGLYYARQSRQNEAVPGPPEGCALLARSQRLRLLASKSIR